MLTYLVLCVGVAIEPVARPTPHDVVAAARESAATVRAYRVVQSTVMHAPLPEFEHEIPSRDRRLPAFRWPLTTKGSTFEDRFDRDVGRAVIRFKGPPKRVRSAKLKVTDDFYKERNGILDESAEDLLWLLHPRFAGFDLMEMLETHPAAKVSTSQGVATVEIPTNALTEYSEMGARLVIDTKRGNAITGIDLYVAAKGREQVFLRVDINLEQVKGGLWMPAAVQEWKLPIPAAGQRMGDTKLCLTAFDWKDSQFVSSMPKRLIELRDVKEASPKKTPLLSGWLLLDYGPSTVADHGSATRVPPRAKSMRTIMLVNIAAIAVIAFCVLLRRRRPR
jgi:hypothetical protein